jgi:hypothetical protein
MFRAALDDKDFDLFRRERQAQEQKPLSARPALMFIHLRLAPERVYPWRNVYRIPNASRQLKVCGEDYDRKTWISRRSEASGL